MRPVPRAYYGFLAGTLIATACLGLGMSRGSAPFLVAALIAFILALVELHESMP